MVVPSRITKAAEDIEKLHGVTSKDRWQLLVLISSLIQDAQHDTFVAQDAESTLAVARQVEVS